jgi:SAM-dependent methyltransferase
MGDTRWYDGFFDERYLRFYPVLRKRPVAPEEAEVVMRLLGLEPGQRVLDLGCGTGRHSVALVQLGLQVVGLDLSETLLEQGRRTAAEAGVEVTWLQRDMRDLDDLDPFDACVSLYTAFGFFGDEEDQEVLRQVAGALKAGGRLLLDLTNHLGYLRRFPVEVWHETGEAVTRERNRYDPLAGVLITRRTAFLKQGGSVELPETRVRAYLPHEVAAMLGRAGFALESMSGALAENAPFSWADSPNQVYLCRRA